MASSEYDAQINHQPIQIVSSENHSFKLQNAYSVAQILKSPKLSDRQVVIVSIAGALRKGKSFLLNFFLKYLNAQVCWKFYSIKLNPAEITKVNDFIFLYFDFPV